jgi:hypothetical protein
MKTIDEYLSENVKPVNFDKVLNVGKINIFEAEDPMAADPLGGGDMGGDPMGGDPMGGPPTGGPSGDDAGFDNAETNDDDEEESVEDKKLKELDLEGHEDDPDATSGIKDIDNATLPAKPAAESIYDFNSLFKSIAAVRSTASEEELKGFDQIEKALTLIGNGKKLKMEDVAFDDPESAMELINKVEEPLDIKLKNYIDLKIKQPIILYRDQNKADIAAKAAENDKARDAIDALNKNTTETEEDKK